MKTKTQILSKHKLVAMLSTMDCFRAKDIEIRSSMSMEVMNLITRELSVSMEKALFGEPFNSDVVNVESFSGILSGVGFP